MSSCLSAAVCSSVRLEYFIAGAPHSFQGRVASARKAGNTTVFLKIWLPDKIQVVNRRNFLRLEPSDHEPVQAFLNQADNGPVTIKVADISGGGLSMCAPTNSPHLFNPNMEIPIRLSLPGCVMVPARITLRNTMDLGDHLRVDEIVKSGSKLLRIAGER